MTSSVRRLRSPSLASASDTDPPPKIDTDGTVWTRIPLPAVACPANTTGPLATRGTLTSVATAATVSVPGPLAVNNPVPVTGWARVRPAPAAVVTVMPSVTATGTASVPVPAATFTVAGPALLLRVSRFDPVIVVPAAELKVSVPAVCGASRVTT